MEAPAPGPSSGVPDAPEPSTLRTWAWPVVKYVVGLAILAIAVYELAEHGNELSGLSKVVEHLNWWWVPPGVLVELGSFVCFAGMQRALLQRGGLVVPNGPILGMTFAAQAIANSLPGGTAVSAVYGFRWFRRFGADVTLATWALAGTLVASVVSLSLVATAGLALATGEGTSLDLIPVIIGAFLLTLAIGALFIYERPLFVVVSWAIRLSRAIVGRPRGNVDEEIAQIMGWVTAVRLGWRQIITILAWGAGNWLLDCACFAMMFQAVHAAVPWKGLLLAYGAGQLAANLPVTPGGLGVVEGSITFALVLFGGGHNSTLSAVLIYRFISFWLILPIGWGAWAVLALAVRRGRWSRDIEEAPRRAGAVAARYDEAERSTVAEPSGARA